VLHKTRTPLHLWFWGAYLVTTATPGISTRQLQRQLGIERYQTAWTMLHKLRRAMVNPEREPLTGAAEVDDASADSVAASVVAGTTGSHRRLAGLQAPRPAGIRPPASQPGAHRLLGEDPDEILPRVHRVISHLKTWLEGTHHGVSKEHEVGRRALRVLFELLVCASFGPSYVVVPESWSSAPALPGLCDLDEVTDVRRRGR